MRPSIGLRLCNCPEWRGGEVREGERLIPAVRVPDGLLLHLIQHDPTGRTIWEDDFDLLSAPAFQDSAYLTSIDHVAEALPASSLPGAVLFWRAVFGMESTIPIDLTDPYGLVSSRAMISPGGGFRLPLNTSGSRDTITGRFVSRSSGAGIQHIAFATADVQASVSALRDKTAILAIPNNYYDDLGARWPLSDEALEGIRRLNVLYDVDAGGEFLHAYTDLFDGRLFFELVERRGSTGFGAANAAFRLAAQSAARG